MTDEKGFTLIEALVATVILAIGILSLFTMTITTIRGNAKAQALTEATTVLTDQKEQLMALAYSDPLLVVGTQTVTTGLPQSVTSLAWTVTDWRSDSSDNDGDGSTDEYDERGIKNISLTANYMAMGETKSQTTQFLKDQIYQ